MGSMRTPMVSNLISAESEQIVESLESLAVIERDAAQEKQDVDAVQNDLPAWGEGFFAFAGILTKARRPFLSLAAHVHYDGMGGFLSGIPELKFRAARLVLQRESVVLTIVLRLYGKTDHIGSEWCYANRRTVKQITNTVDVAMDDFLKSRLDNADQAARYANRILYGLSYSESVIRFLDDGVKQPFLSSVRISCDRILRVLTIGLRGANESH